MAPGGGSRSDVNSRRVRRKSKPKVNPPRSSTDSGELNGFEPWIEQFGIEPKFRGGLREQNKRDKLTRIIAAARELFGRTGFEITTMREVAAAARVGAGTLFLYAHSKEDLLVLVFLTELRPVTAKGFRNVPPGNLLSQMMFSFSPIIEHHARNMLLSRPFLRDVAWVSKRHAPVIAEFQAEWRQYLISLVDAAKARGEIRSEIDSSLAANCCRIFFLSHLRSWVAGHVDRDQFEQSLRASLQLLLTGLD